MLALAASGAAFLVATRPDAKSGLAEARDVVAREDDFATADGAANAMLRISTLLEHEGEACAAASSEADNDCRALFAGAGHMQASSVGILRCARPELFDVQQALRAYLDRLAENPARTPLPKLPYCT